MFNFKENKGYYKRLDDLTKALNEEREELKKRIQEYKVDSVGKYLTSVINQFRIEKMRKRRLEIDIAKRNKNHYEGLKRLFEKVKEYENEEENKNRLDNIINSIDENINKTKELLSVLGYKENEHNEYNKRI